MENKIISIDSYDFLIEYQPNGYQYGLEPIIRCILVDSDDPRDKLLRSWLDGLGYESSWAKVELYSKDTEGQTEFRIFPIKDSELNNTFYEIRERIGQINLK